MISTMPGCDITTLGSKGQIKRTTQETTLSTYFDYILGVDTLELKALEPLSHQSTDVWVIPTKQSHECISCSWCLVWDNSRQSQHVWNRVEAIIPFLAGLPLASTGVMLCKVQTRDTLVWLFCTIPPRVSSRIVFRHEMVKIQTHREHHKIDKPCHC